MSIFHIELATKGRAEFVQQILTAVFGDGKKGSRSAVPPPPPTGEIDRDEVADKLRKVFGALSKGNGRRKG